MRTPRSANAAPGRCPCAAGCPSSRASWAGSTRRRSSASGPRQHPTYRDPDELHDVLLSLVAIRPRAEWAGHFGALAAQGRAFEVQRRDDVLWGATERRRELEALFPGASFSPDHALPVGLLRRRRGGSRRRGDKARAGSSRGRRSGHGRRAQRRHQARAIRRGDRPRGAAGARVRAERPVRARAGRAVVRPAAARPHPLLYARAPARRDPPDQPGGVAGVPRVVVARRPGDPAPRPGGPGRGDRAAARGSNGRPASGSGCFAERVESYQPEWLDDLCLSGEVAWGRLSVLEPASGTACRTAGSADAAAKTPSRRTPITFMLRDDLPWLLQAHRGAIVPARAGRRAGAGGARRAPRPRRAVPRRPPRDHEPPSRRDRGGTVGRRRARA